jgi:hypothetical protein
MMGRANEPPKTVVGYNPEMITEQQNFGQHECIYDSKALLPIVQTMLRPDNALVNGKRRKYNP